MPHTKAQRKVWYEGNKERLKAYNAKYHAAHSTKICERKKTFRANNPEIMHAKDKKYHLAHREAEIQRSHVWNASPAGKTAQRRYQDTHPFYVREKVQVRRARKKATEVDPIKNVLVFERDLWVCQICHRKVDTSLEYPHPFSSSLDHIIPLAKGGTHTMDNIQLAHLTCNVKKHAKVIAA